LHSSDTEKKWKYNETVHQLFIDFKKAYDSVRREVLYSIFVEFGIPIKLVGLIEVNIYLKRLLFKIVSNKEILHHHSFSTLF
jgi:hypothetical protein